MIGDNVFSLMVIVAGDVRVYLSSKNVADLGVGIMHTPLAPATIEVSKNVKNSVNLSRLFISYLTLNR